ncbi:MAG TPA: hypothetical protein PKD59_17680 [Miltoncostaeaceae bacterium]|nr:hypothetical protein [Miltoncostaeaceae bacterium]
MKPRAAVTALIAMTAAIVLAVLAAPPAQGAEQLLEVIDVPASGARVQSATVLRPGAAYRISVNSTVEMSYPGGRTELLDALHCFGTSGGAPIPGDDCLETPPPKISVLRFDIGGVGQGTIVGLDGRVPEYNPAHEYVASFTPSAGGTLGATVGPFLNGTGAGKLIISLYGEPPSSAPGAPAPAVPPNSILGQHPIVGPPLFRIIALSRLEQGAAFVRPAAGAAVIPQVGLLLGEGDEVTVGSGSPFAVLTLQALPSGAIFTLTGGASRRADGRLSANPVTFVASAAPQLMTGELSITTAKVRAQQGQQRLPAGGPAFVLTPVARIDADGGDAHVAHDPTRGRTTVRNVRGTATVTPTSRPPLRLAPGRQVQVTVAGAGRPVPLVPADLATSIPSPRDVRAGPAVATGPAVISLRSLKRSKCVTVLVSSTKPARVLVTIFSGRRSIRLFGQRLVVFAAAGRTETCIRVPARARTFDVRTPLRFAVGYALGARARRGEPATRPAIRPIRLVP